MVVYDQVTWSDGTINPPPDTPICGFIGELCVKPEEGKTNFRNTMYINYLIKSDTVDDM